MVAKVLLFCIVSTALMFRFPALGRPLGIVVGLCVGVLVIMGVRALHKALIKLFNYL